MNIYIYIYIYTLYLYFYIYYIYSINLFIYLIFYLKIKNNNNNTIKRKFPNTFYNLILTLTIISYFILLGNYNMYKKNKIK